MEGWNGKGDGGLELYRDESEPRTAAFCANVILKSRDRKNATVKIGCRICNYMTYVTVDDKLIITVHTANSSSVCELAYEHTNYNIVSY